MPGVPRTGYYAWLRRREIISQHPAEQTKQDAKMVERFEAKKRRYGSPCLTRKLEAESLIVDRKTVA